MRYVEFGKADALPGVFAEMVKERDTALLIWDAPRVDQVAGQILDLAVKHRIPTIVDDVRWAQDRCPHGLWPEGGRLIPASGDARGSHPEGREAGRFAHRAADHLRADLQLKTAKALGLTIPQAIPLLADQLIEHWRVLFLGIRTMLDVS